jgi:HD-like signal output (HDOD) protein
MPGMALGTTTIENIVAHDAAALEKDLASIRQDASVSLPGVPQIVTRLQQMLSDPEIGIPQLVPVINYEAVLVGRILQMANSAALNPTRRQITDIKTGVTRVGFDLLRSAALAYALRQVSQAHSVKDIRPHLEALWERSAWTAAVSFVIARKFTKVNRDIAFLGGLMHGVGKLFILTRAAHYPFVLRDRTKYSSMLRKSILTGWRISEEVINAVVDYENLNREVVGDEPDLTDILATSYLVVGHAGRMQDLSMTVEKIAAFSRLRLDIMAVEETLENAKEEIEDLRLAIK